MQSAGEAAKEIVSRELGLLQVDLQPLSGGCISSAFKVSVPGAEYFIKVNAENKGLFAAESEGLRLLKDTHTVNVPEVIASGIWGDYGFLILELIHSGRPASQFWDKFAEGLASLHKNTSDYYGLSSDNYIGALPQINSPGNNWIEFFITHRLEYQLKMAMDAGKIPKSVCDDFQLLYKKLPDLLVLEPPALIHGDLWSGNFIVNSKGEAALIDPAVYYAHREIEIAFTTLFGGFDSRFYSVYQEVFPFQPGFEDRIDIYNLYPLLVHVNLFGGSYLGSVKSILKRLV
ncbi:MAG TPA: fructosamine kinase family protein [Cytophagaceae bacterium]